MGQSSIKVLIVNTYDVGGAANSCIRLHLGLLNNNVKSKLLVKQKFKNYKYVYSFIKSVETGLFSRIVAISFKMLKKIEIFNFFFKNKNEFFLKNRDKRLELFSFPNSKYDITSSPLYEKADIINLHWVAGFLDYKSFFKKNTKPVVWTLHDMNPFSGGEHYNETLFNLGNDYKPMNRVVSVIEKKIINKNIKIKKKALKKIDNLTIVTPSKWLMEEAKKSALFKNRNVFLIPYGLDVSIYNPKNQIDSRKYFSIPNDKKVVLFVAHSINNNRKGFSFLKAALEKYNKSDILLCYIGKVVSPFVGLNNTLYLGEIKDDKIMSLAYSAADVFVIPSLMDNLPNTVLESLLCGTPVIGFAVGGIPEMISHNENGLLADNISVESLLKTINIFFKEGVVKSRGEISYDAIKKYDKNIQAKRYMKLFENILEQI